MCCTKIWVLRGRFRAPRTSSFWKTLMFGFWYISLISGSQHITTTRISRRSQAYLSITQSERKVNTSSLATSIRKTRGFSFSHNPAPAALLISAERLHQPLHCLSGCGRLEPTCTLKDRKQDIQHSTGLARLTAWPYLIPETETGSGTDQASSVWAADTVGRCSSRGETRHLQEWPVSLLILKILWHFPALDIVCFRLVFFLSIVLLTSVSLHLECPFRLVVWYIIQSFSAHGTHRHAFMISPYFFSIFFFL